MGIEGEPGHDGKIEQYATPESRSAGPPKADGKNRSVLDEILSAAAKDAEPVDGGELLRLLAKAAQPFLGEPMSEAIASTLISTMVRKHFPDLNDENAVLMSQQIMGVIVSDTSSYGRLETLWKHLNNSSKS